MVQVHILKGIEFVFPDDEKEYTELLIAQVRKETIEECEQVAQDWLDKHFFYDKRCEAVREVLAGIKALGTQQEE